MGEGGATLTLGPPMAARIVFEARAGRADIAQAADLARDSRAMWSLGGRPEDWIVGQGNLGVLRLVRGQAGSATLLDELRGIERCTGGREKGLAAIFAAVLSAEKGSAGGLKAVEGAPAFFAQLAEGRDARDGQVWSDLQLEENIGSCLGEVRKGGGLCRPEAGPVDSARFWLGMGERLWNPDIRKQLSQVQLGATTRRILVMLAGSWMELRPEGRVLVRGVPFRLRGAARRLAWPQVLEWEAGDIGQAALKYLTAYHTSFRFDGILMGLLGFDSRLDDLIVPLVAASESRSLLEEAAIKWTCDPFGSFRVDLPARTPLSRWGVTSLRVWILPREGLWVALEKDDQPGACLQWSVRPPHLRRWVVDEKAIPAMHLTLSALWRDLKIGGREVMLAEEKGQPEAAEKGGQALRLYGRIRWGSKAELARILRQAYPVEEHVRVLSQGMRATRRAYRWAASEGIVLRPGTTFVRRHERGKPDETAANVPLKAQGLARLILASRPGKNQQSGASTR